MKKQIQDIEGKNLVVAIFSLIFFVLIVTALRSGLFFSFNNQNTDNYFQKDSDSLDPAVPYAPITPEDLRKRTINEDLTLLDIRPFAEYAQEHIIDSINLPIDEFPAGEKIIQNKAIVIIGVSGNDDRIGIAIQKLREENRADIMVLAGGLDAWIRQGGMTVSYGDPNSFVDQSKVAYIDPEKVRSFIDDKEKLFLLDVRTPDQFSRGHIKNSINIPFDEIEQKRHQIPAHKQVAIIGINELQEFQAGAQINDMLLIRPLVIKGGYPFWEQKGLNTEK